MTPQSSKSTLDKVKDGVTNAGDKAQRYYDRSSWQIVPVKSLS